MTRLSQAPEDYDGPTLGDWKHIATDGFPQCTRETAPAFFCWGPGWKRAEVLEFWPGDERIDFLRAPCFGDDQGQWSDVTHYMPVQYPEPPVVKEQDQ